MTAKQTEYSPGPWEIAGGTTESRFYIHGANTVCEFPNPKGYYQSPAEREANARLISAAPELLEVLEMIHRVMIQRNMAEDEQQVADQAWTAIRKAKG